MKEKEPNNPVFSAAESPVPLPQIEDAWMDMRKKLDESMPERRSPENGKRLGILLLLLILPLRMLWVMEHGDRAGRAPHEEEPAIGQSAKEESSIRAGGTQSNKGSGIAGAGKAVSENAQSGNRQPADAPSGSSQSENGQSGNGQPADQRTGQARTPHEQSEDEGTQQASIQHEQAPQERIRHQRIQQELSQGKRQKGLREQGEQEAGTQTGTLTGVMQRAVIDAKLASIGSRASIRVWKMNPRGGTIVKKENNTNKAAQRKKVRTDDSTRILYAAGLQDSKSFPVGAQQVYDYNVNGKKAFWSDYIPSPYFQFHVSQKIALQAAIQLNNPQYTESVTIFRKAGDSIPGNVSTTDTSVLVRKLYYFNFPLIIFYHPFRGLYLGAGLQYSNLRNGIALQNNIVHHFFTPAITDTITSFKVIDLKADRPAYNNLKKADWRALFEVDYYWKRTTLGLQYQQALSNYLYTPVDGSPGKDKNSSFNLYIRYNIWERRIPITRR